MLLLAGSLFALAWPATSSAYCWGADPTMPGSSPDYYSAPKEYRRAQYVAVVKVLSETWLDDDGKPAPLKPPFQFGLPRPWGFDPYMGAKYRVEVIERLKGSPPKQLTLFSENTTARFWLDVGQSYLVFITPEQHKTLGKVETLDNCGNSEVYKPGSETNRIVRSLARRP
jgi:hypothetical protein